MARILVLFVFIGFSLHSFAAVSAVSRHPANVIGKFDERGKVRDLGPAHFTPAEIFQIRNSMGYLVCPGKDIFRNDDHGNKVADVLTSSAFLIGGDTVVTVAHQFFAARGVKRTEKGSWNTCYFQTQGNHPAIYKIKGGDKDIVFGTRTPAEDTRNDYAIVKLVTPVPNAKPFMFLDSAVLKSGDTIFPIIASRDKKYSPADKEDLRDEPLMQSCTIRKTFMGEASVRPSHFYSDCDNTLGGSGGPILQRIEGRLVVMGMTTATGFAADGAEYSDVRHRVLRHVAMGQAYDGRPFFYKTPEAPCPDRGPRSTLVLIEEARADRFNQAHPAVYELVRHECKTLDVKDRVVTNQDYQIDPAHREVVLYKGHKYLLDASMVATNIQPPEVISVAYSLHTDSTFLRDLQASSKSSPLIGAPEPTAAPPVQRVTTTATPRPPAVPVVNPPASRISQPTGSSGFVWN